MKRICGNCKASVKVNICTFGCELGYNVETIVEKIEGKMPRYVDGKPLDECPKPLSTKKFVELLIAQRKTLINSNSI